MLSNSPNHQEQALQQLYGGIKQDSADSIAVYLEKRLEALQKMLMDSQQRGLSTKPLIQKVVNGLRNKNLSQLTSSFVITLPFNYNQFRDVVIQFELRLPSHPPAVHAIRTLKCYRCKGAHLAKECPNVSCYKCAGQHKTVQCNITKNKLHCTKCNMSNHTTAGHREFPGKPQAGNGEEVGVFTCYSAGTSFVDGAVSITMEVKFFLSIVNFCQYRRTFALRHCHFGGFFCERDGGGRQKVRTGKFT